MLDIRPFDFRDSTERELVRYNQLRNAIQKERLPEDPPESGCGVGVGRRTGSEAGAGSWQPGAQ